MNKRLKAFIDQRDFTYEESESTLASVEALASAAVEDATDLYEYCFDKASKVILDSEGEKSEDEKSEGEKSEDEKSEDEKSEDEKSEDEKSEDEKSEDEKSEDEKADDIIGK